MRGNKSAKQRGNTQGKCVFRYQVPKHVTLNNVVMVTGIIGIQELAGYRIFWLKINGKRDTKTPPPLPSFPNGGSIVSVTFEPVKICLRTELIPG